MLRMFVAIALTALTLVGGHFYNRRWDRAVLFFVLFLLGGAAVSADLMWRVSGHAPAGDLAAMSMHLSFVWDMFGLGLLALWILSVTFAFLDARRADPPAYRWTISGFLGAVGLSAASGVAIFAAAVSLLTMRLDHGLDFEAAGAPPAAANYEQRDFMHYVYLGRLAESGRDFPRPPEGQGYLRGRFTYDGKPAAGVNLSLVLNGKYESKRLATDEKGEFTLRVPNGQWVINRLATDEWAGRPNAGSYVVTTGEEPKLNGSEYNDFYWTERDGSKVVVSGQAGEPQLNFTIRKRVALTWPAARPKPMRTALADGVIAWDPYPGAETYLLRIAELKRDGRSTTFYPVAARPIVGATQLPLASLAAAASDVEKEYEVSVLAFAKDGTFLSRSNDRLDARTFVLADKQRLVGDEERAVARTTADTKPPAKIDDNRRRIEAVETLLKDGLVKEAERLLGKVDGKAEPGKKLAVAGYIAAKRGRCVQAKGLLAKARAEGGPSGVPDYYYAGCRK